MQRHAEGSSNLWNKQTECSSSIHSGTNSIGRRKSVKIVTPNSSSPSTPSPSTNQIIPRSSNEWVVLPVFVDIVRLALKAREDCCIR